MAMKRLATIPLTIGLFLPLLRFPSSSPNSISQNLRDGPPVWISLGTAFAQFAVIALQLAVHRDHPLAPTAFLTSVPFIVTQDGGVVLYDFLHTSSFLGAFLLWVVVIQSTWLRRALAIGTAAAFAVASAAGAGYWAVFLEIVAVYAAFL